MSGLPTIQPQRCRLFKNDNRLHEMIEITASEGRANPASRLIGLGLLLVAMYACMRTLRFTNDWLNLVFGGLFLCVPFLAIPPVLRLHGKARMATAVILIPILAIATLGLLALAVGDIPAVAVHREMSRQLSTLQQRGY